MGDAPSFSMSSRAGMVATGEISPGPKYAPHHVSPRGEGPMGNTGLLYAFGSETRFGFDGTLGPGPGTYPLGTSIGNSTKVGFGTARQRDQTQTNRGQAFLSEGHHKSVNHGLHSPGPLKYAIEGTIGAVSGISSMPCSPRYSMRSRVPDLGKKGPGAQIGPAPSAYVLPSSLGSQPISMRPSSNSFSFQKSMRTTPQSDYKKHRHTGKGFERANYGVHSPGPCKYETRTPRGSRDKMAPSYSFGTDERLC